MSVEIYEVRVRAVVEPNNHSTRFKTASPESNSVDRKRLIEEAVEKVLDILERKKEA